MTRPLLQSKMKQDGDLRTLFCWSHDRTFSGFVIDAADLSRKFVVELLVDGVPLKLVHATDHLASIGGVSIGDDCYGFCFSLDAQTLNEAEVVEARIANTAVRVGESIAIRSYANGDPALTPSSNFQWLGGVRFSGWVGNDHQGVIEVQVDGEDIMHVQPTGWCHTGAADAPRAARAFNIHLPQRFADGAVHRVAAIDSAGAHLEGSPFPFVAFVDRLAGGSVQRPSTADIENLRAGILDQLVPMSVPFAAYDQWRTNLPKVAAGARPRTAAVVSVGSGEIEDTFNSLESQTHPDWVAMSLPDMGSYAGLDCKQALQFLSGEAADAEFSLFVLAGTILAPDAIARLADAFDRDPGLVAAYGDLEIASGDGSLWPLALPAFDHERMLEQGYCSHVFALRTPVARTLLKTAPATLYRLFNSLFDYDSNAGGRIAHLPGALAVLPLIDRKAASAALAAATWSHLQHRGVDARVDLRQGQMLPAVKVTRSPDDGMVSILIPTRNQKALLETCLGSLRAAGERRRIEIIVMDNESSDRDMLDYLASINGKLARVIRIEGVFNFARLNNVAAAAANGNFLCLLNNDVQALDGEWLEEMLGRISEPDVGAVGALLLWPSGIVQHGGVVLGANFAATHAFNDRMDGDAGYGDLLRVAHQCSAVTAACLLTRRNDYLDVGGMDEFRFPVNFNDVDYCLKLRAAGKRVVFTPDAKLMHLESASRGTDRRPDRKARLDRELRNLRAKWADVLMDDAFYSPLLSLDPVPFSALAWPLRSMDFRRLKRPTPVHVPPGF